ncbi:uncharacterized protein LOC134276091 [Saccostrea cucullata]|uniref:uncharacterized protein LOC134276091 n=1 Tax=Saccostrea cuccullata TaxID=36930 RepID=UPI002ED07F65
MGNGITERFNSTLLCMLRTLENSQKADWKSHINSLVHAYNSTTNDTTGYSPFYLMFGREPNLPIDVIFGFKHPDEEGCNTKYIDRLKQRLQEAYRLANTAVKHSQQRQKEHYNLRGRAATLQVGDRVLVKIVAYDGKHKIADKWVDEPYVVVAKANEDIPVYKVRREDGEGRFKVLHRNLLLPIGSKLQKPTPLVKPPRGRRKAVRKEVPVETVSIENSFSDSFVAYPTMQTEDSHTDTPSQDGDGHSLTEEASVIGSGEDAFQQDEPVDHAEEDYEDADVDEDTQPDVDEDSQSDVDEDADDVDMPSHPDHTDHQEDEPSTQVPVPAPRRSTRAKSKPPWTKDFIMMNQSVTQPDWLQRANYITVLMQRGTLQSVDSSVCQLALLNLVSSSSK